MISDVTRKSIKNTSTQGNELKKITYLVQATRYCRPLALISMPSANFIKVMEYKMAQKLTFHTDLLLAVAIIFRET